MPQESRDFGEYRGRAAGFIMAPGEGFEPPTNRVTADRSTTELPRNRWDRKTPRNSRKAKNLKAFAARLPKPVPEAGPREGRRSVGSMTRLEMEPPRSAARARPAAAP